VHLGVVFLIEGQILNGLHDISLAHVYHGLDVVDEALVLYLCGILDSLFDLDWVLVYLGPQFRRHLDLHMRLGNVVLQDQEHRLVAMKKYLVLMRIEVLR
jgi:hypothetical protein